MVTVGRDPITAPLSRRQTSGGAVDRNGTPLVGNSAIRERLAPSLHSKAVMNRPQLLASLAAALLLGAAPATAFAQSPDLAASASSTRVERRFSLASVTNLLGGYPMVGAAAQYQLSDRIAVGGQLTLGVLVIDAGLSGRVFLNAEQRSGLYLDLSAHAVGGPLAEGLGGVAELGYQYRARSGFLFEAGGGLAVLHTPSNDCACHPPGMEESPWHAIPQLTLRFGYAF
jgi:hypothetical protein